MIEVRKHGTRDFAVYEDGQLLAVVRYRKGGQAIKDRIEMLQERIQGLTQGGGTPEAIPTAATSCESH